MVILKAKIVIEKCPETGQQVTLKDCRKCDFYRHWGSVGNFILVACKSTKLENINPKSRLKSPP